MPPLLDLGLQGHVALVTGANHGIGAATALILASHGAAVVVSNLRIPDPGESAAYRRSSAMGAEHVLTTSAEKVGRAVALEADLGDVLNEERTPGRTSVHLVRRTPDRGSMRGGCVAAHQKVEVLVTVPAPAARSERRGWCAIGGIFRA